MPIGAKTPPFGGPVPVIRIHAHEEPEIVRSLVQMKTGKRKCGKKPMLTAEFDYENIPNQETVFGQELPEAEKTDGFDPAENDNEPIFSFDYKSIEDIGPPFRRSEFHMPDNDNLVKFKVA